MKPDDLRRGIEGRNMMGSMSYSDHRYHYGLPFSNNGSLDG